jgi:hypothetical protein
LTTSFHFEKIPQDDGVGSHPPPLATGYGARVELKGEKDFCAKFDLGAPFSMERQ